MSVRPLPKLSPEEYLTIERAAETKSEFYAGEMFAMAGATREHNLVAGNLYVELNISLREKPCEAYVNDMRVLVQANGLYTYPDVVVACDEPAFHDELPDTLLNPTLIVEVLSDSTERYDRGKKFKMYRQLSSLKEYVLVAQDIAHVEVYTRLESGIWQFTEAKGLDSSITFSSLQLTLSLQDIYNKVTFPEPEQLR